MHEVDLLEVIEESRGEFNSSRENPVRARKTDGEKAITVEKRSASV